MYYRLLQFFFFVSSLRKMTRMTRRGYFYLLYSFSSKGFRLRVKSIDIFKRKSLKLALCKGLTLAGVNAGELSSSPA